MRFRSTHLLFVALILVIIIGIIINAVVINITERNRAILSRPPDIQILVTGKMHGRFELCGCPGERAMSLPERASAIRRLTLNEDFRKKLLLVESGDFTSDKQSISVAMAAFKILGYDLVATAPSDHIYINEVLSHAGKLGLRLLTRDVNAGKGLSDLCKPLWVLDCSHFKVGFVTTGKQPVSDDALRYKWDEVMRDVEAASSDADVVILINYWDWEKLEHMMNMNKAKEQIALFVSHSSPQLQRRYELKMHFGVPTIFLSDTLLPMPLVRIWMHEGKVRRVDSFDYTVPPLNVPDEQIQKLVNDYYRERQNRLKALWPVLVRRAKEKAYVLPSECAKCHEAENRQWLKTKHATAVLTLKERHRLEPNCLKCHSEEFIQTKRLTRTGKGSGVECVSCHVELKDPVKVKEHGQMPSEKARLQRIDPLKVCTPCHNKEHSPNFESMMQDYLNKVKH